MNFVRITPGLTVMQSDLFYFSEKSADAVIFISGSSGEDLREPQTFLVNEKVLSRHFSDAGRNTAAVYQNL